MIPFLTAREFPDFDQQVEESIQHFTDLSIACDCAVRRMPDWSEALTQVVYKHRISLAAIAPPEQFDLTKDVNVHGVLHRVRKAIVQILEYERRVQAVRDCPAGDHKVRRARAEALAETHRVFLAANEERIGKEICSRVLPVVKEITSAGLPAVSVAAPIYFMARAVLWNVWPAFAREHEESLKAQSEPYKNPDPENEWSFGGQRPNLFLDIHTMDPPEPEQKVGYLPSTPHLAMILAGLESSDPSAFRNAAPKQAHSSSMLPMLARTLQVLGELMLPASLRRAAATPFGRLVAERSADAR